ncbi:unnamed protein product, partial [Brugia timori]|uniref:Cytochrome b-c1 complex subunit 7 n=1 Tax=Brugia timori TaxID=42155 RepID=A0A0R3R7Z6_9BILA
MLNNVDGSGINLCLANIRRKKIPRDNRHFGTVALSQPSLIARWDNVSPAAKNIKFTYNGKLANMLRYYLWSYGWSGRRYGLLFHDQCFEPAPEVKEALRRLNLKEPWLFDERKIRLYHAHTMKSHGEQLPKEKWTKWEDET